MTEERKVIGNGPAGSNFQSNKWAEHPVEVSLGLSAPAWGQPTVALEKLVCYSCVLPLCEGVEEDSDLWSLGGTCRTSEMTYMLYGWQWFLGGAQTLVNWQRGCSDQTAQISWGNLNKCLFTPERAPTICQRKISTTSGLGKQRVHWALLQERLFSVGITAECTPAGND